MMMLASLAALGGVALALPAPAQIKAVDMLGAMTRDDLVNADGDCPASIFIFARGSTESGNLVSPPIPPLPLPLLPSYPPNA